MDNLDYVYTKNGPIYKYDIPVIVNEKPEEKLQKAGLFFIIIIIVFMILFYLAKTEVDTHKTIKLNKIVLEDNAKCVKTSIEMNKMVIYDKNSNTDFLENIILLDKSGNTFDVKFRIYKGDNGGYYSVDLQECYDIKEVILISNKKNYINLICHNNGKIVWKYSGWIDNKENSIPVTKKFI